MIPIKPSSTVEVTDTFVSGRHIKTTIAPQFMGHIMQILAGLYKDKLLAMVREYCTNAYDSHVEAGNRAPIQVTLPTHMDPFLVVKDFGIGMNAETVENTYSQYGNSTKQTRNDLNGTLGIGCKVAMAYARQFTVTAIKDGIKTQVVISVNPDGTGDMDVVAEVETVDPNGVEVRIPINIMDVDRLNHVAQKFFRYWKPGTVLLNGEDPSVTLDPIADITYTSPRSGEVKTVALFYDKEATTDRIVMGNVAYPCSNIEGMNPLNGNGAVVAYVEMGEISFPPSRDAVEVTGDNIAVIREIRTSVLGELHRTANDEISNAVDYAAAYAAANKWRKAGLAFQTAPQYDGVDIPLGLWAVNSAGREYFTTFDKNAYRNSVRQGHTRVSEVPETGYVTNKPADKDITQTVKKKVRHVSSEFLATGQPIRYWVFLPDADIPGEPWVKPAKVIDWSDLKNIKLPKATPSSYGGNGVLYDGGYDVYDKNTGRFAIRDVKTTEEIYYFGLSDLSPTRFVKYKEATELMQVLTTYVPSATLVAVGAARQAKFKRTYPNAKPIAYLFDKVGNALRAAVTPTDCDVAAYYSMSPRNGVPTLINAMKGAVLHDKELASLLDRISKAKSVGYSSVHNDIDVWKKYVGKVVPIVPSKDLDLAPFSKKYPLIDLVAKSYYPVNDAIARELAEYINLKYDAQKGN